MSIITEWFALSGTEQRQMVKSATLRLAYLYYGGIATLNRSGMETEDHISAGYIEVLENMTAYTVQEVNNERAGKGMEAITLKGFLYKMVNRYLARTLYWVKLDARNGGGTLDTVNDEVQQGDFSEHLITTIDVHRFLAGRDERDRQIAELLKEYRSERSIGKELGISGVAVHNRIVNMRSALSTGRF